MSVEIRPLPAVPSAATPPEPASSAESTASGPTEPTDPGHAPLSLRLRAATRAAHEAAESRAFVTDLMAGRLTAAAHTDLTSQYLTIYEALETTGRALAGTCVDPILTLRLDRTQSLRGDLGALLGPEPDVASARLRCRPEPVPAALEYAEHLRSLADSPAGWAAHAYTRYLGDLSGGQAIAGALRRNYGLPEQVLTFYAFPGSLPRLRESFRSRLDALPLTAAEARIAEDEAVVAFDYAGRLFDQLAERHCH